MIIVNVKFNECVKFTLYASNSHVNDIHWDLTPINASNSRIAFKRTETARLGVSLPTAVVIPKRYQNA